MRTLLSAVLLGAAPLLPERPDTPPPTPTPLPEESSGIVGPDPEWVEPPGDDDCLFVVEPLTKEVRILSTLSATRPHLDILPHLCPNDLHVNDGGGAAMIAALRVLVIGNDFDVTQVDLGTLRLSLPNQQFVDDNSVLLAPYAFTFMDDGTPYEDDAPCGCNALGADGALDLDLKFSRALVIQGFQLQSQPNGANVRLRLSGRSPGGLGFRVLDCVHILQN